MKQILATVLTLTATTGFATGSVDLDAPFSILERTLHDDTPSFEEYRDLVVEFGFDDPTPRYNPDSLPSILEPNLISFHTTGQNSDLNQLSCLQQSLNTNDSQTEEIGSLPNGTQVIRCAALINQPTLEGVTLDDRQENLTQRIVDVLDLPDVQIPSFDSGGNEFFGTLVLDEPLAVGSTRLRSLATTFGHESVDIEWQIVRLPDDPTGPAPLPQ